SWFGAAENFPESFMPVFEKEQELAYGENPHQAAAYYSEVGARRHLLSMVTQLHGRDLSFNNLNDLSAARLVAREFELPACVIVKHANPCGVAVAGSIEQAYQRALAADPLSAYGGVIVLNRPVSEALGERLAEQFVEVLFAPGYDPAALEKLKEKPATRILEDRERRLSNPGERDYRRVLGGLLVQERDWDVDDREGMQVICGEPDELAWGAPCRRWGRAPARGAPWPPWGPGSKRRRSPGPRRPARCSPRPPSPPPRPAAAGLGRGRHRDHSAGRFEARRRGGRGSRARR